MEKNIIELINEIKETHVNKHTKKVQMLGNIILESSILYQKINAEVAFIPSFIAGLLIELIGDVEAEKLYAEARDYAQQLMERMQLARAKLDGINTETNTTWN